MERRDLRPGEVPRIIHHTAPSDRMRWDPHWEPCLRTWMSVCPEPQYKHLSWNDDELRELVKEAFPQHLEAYDGYREHIQRVDFARAAMLHIHGGLYVDMDVEARGSPFAAFPAGLVSVVASPYTRNEKHQNSMMASPPRHPFWPALADEAVRRQRHPEQYRTTWQLTGPQLLDAVIEARREEVHALPHETYNPSMQSPGFHDARVLTRHFCTSVWTHSMDIRGMRLHRAARSGDQAAVAVAAQDGVDLECCDYAGLTAMHHAALRGDSAMVACLASHHADVSVGDKNSTTPLHYAVQVSKVPVVRALLGLCAALDRGLREGAFAGATPLDLAAAMAREAPGLNAPAQEVWVLLQQAASSSLASRSGDAAAASAEFGRDAAVKGPLLRTHSDTPAAFACGFSLRCHTTDFSCRAWRAACVAWPSRRSTAPRVMP